MQNIISVQKQMAENNNKSSSWNIPSLSITIPQIGQFTRQLNELINNTIRESSLNNQTTLNVLDAARENFIYNRATDAVSNYNTNMTKIWNSFFAMAQQQQQFFFR